MGVWPKLRFQQLQTPETTNLRMLHNKLREATMASGPTKCARERGRLIYTKDDSCDFDPKPPSSDGPFRLYSFEKISKTSSQININLLV